MEEREGPVRSVERAVRIVKALGASPLEGARLSDIAAATGLGKSTAHRIVSALAREGFLYQNLENRRYYLGYEVARLAHASSSLVVAEAARPSLDRLAAESGDVVFVQIREGRESICLDRRVGNYPIKILTLNIGDRRPLGVGAGSLALLAWMPEEQRADYLATYEPLEAYGGFTVETLSELIATSRENGFSVNEGRIVPGMVAVGVPVLDSRGHAIAALSIAAIRERLTGERREKLVALLKEEADVLWTRLKAKHAGAIDGL